jgi:hypothetical protein
VGSRRQPYRIRGIVTIPQGVRVTLLPGTVVQGWTHSSNKGRLDVYGELVSEGKFAASKRVYFTSSRDLSPPTLGGSDEGQTGDWQGLRFYAGSFATLTGATVRYATTGVGGSPAVVSGVRFEKNGTGVSMSSRQSPVVVECQFFGSTSYAAYLSSCNGRLNFRGLSGTGNRWNGVYLSYRTQQGPRDEDLDGDGVVGLPDLSIALLNFTRVGDP